MNGKIYLILFFPLLTYCFSGVFAYAEFTKPFFEGDFRDAQGFMGTTYDYDLFHLGKDYCVNKAGKNSDDSLYGTIFYSIEQGNIIKYRYSVPANYADGVGNYVIVDHGGGVVSVYMHLANIYIKSGWVTPDNVLGEAGDFILHRKDNCPHLHIEIRKNGVSSLNVYPNLRYSYVNKDGKTKIVTGYQFKDEKAVLSWIDDNFYDPDTFLSTKWANITPGETKSNMFLSKDGGVHYLGENIYNLKRFEGIKVSPKSKKNGFVAIIAWDYDKGGIDLFLLDTNKRNIIAKTNNWTERKALGGIAAWVSWSPEEYYVLISTGGEGVRELSYIDIRTGVIRDISLKRFGEKYSGNIDEMQIVDIRKVLWKSNTKISVPINIYCNPYDDDSCKENLPIRRIIEANIDLNNIENISYTEKYIIN